MKSGCPYCAGKRPIIGENDLKTTYPHLCEEWDYEKNVGINPGDFIYGSNKVVEGNNDLTTTHPDIAVDWDYEKNIILPTEVTHGSNKTVWWKCKNGHVKKESIKNRCKNKGCSICNN